MGSIQEFHEPKKPLEKVHFLNSQGSEAITEADYDTMHHPHMA